MARKATDLLDVFRFNNEDGNDGHERKARRKAAQGGSSKAGASKSRKSPGAAKKKKPTGSAFDGIHLGPRQLLLTSCAGLLLLVLSFTLGLATGRPGSGDSSGPALTRQSLVMMRTSIPLIDPATRKKTDPARVRRVLSKDHGVPNQNIRIYGEAGRLYLEVGPFKSEKQADQYRRSKSLDLAHINMEDPFRWVQYVPYRR